MDCCCWCPASSDFLGLGFGFLLLPADSDLGRLLIFFSGFTLFSKGRLCLDFDLDSDTSDLFFCVVSFCDRAGSF